MVLSFCDEYLITDLIRKALAFHLFWLWTSRLRRLLYEFAQLVLVSVAEYTTDVWQNWISRRFNLFKPRPNHLPDMVIFIQLCLYAVVRTNTPRETIQSSWNCNWFTRDKKMWWNMTMEFCNVVCHEIVQQSLKLLGIEVKRFHHRARRDMTFGWFHHEIGLLSGRRACQYSLTWLIRGNRLHNFIRSKSFRFVAWISWPALIALANSSAR